MASPALDEAITARFEPPFHAWYDVTHDGPPGREHKGRVEKQARYGLGAITAQAADGPRLAGAWRSLRRDLALGGASGEPTGRRLCHLVLHIGLGFSLSLYSADGDPNPQFGPGPFSLQAHSLRVEVST